MLLEWGGRLLGELHVGMCGKDYQLAMLVLEGGEIFAEGWVVGASGSLEKKKNKVEEFWRDRGFRFYKESNGMSWGMGERERVVGRE